MAPKRQKKAIVAVENLEKYKNIVINDVLCPICRSIFIEPVTLPCSHGFCLSCFNNTMENTTLTCPLCRIRIGSWLRTARKENKVINDYLWQTMQLKFPKEIQKKKEGVDVENDEKIAIRLANAGEIRKEYEIQLAKDQLELQKQREAEEKASEMVIKRLLEEEQNAVKIESEKVRSDEEVAKRLANDLCNAGPSNSSNISKKPKKISIESYFVAMNKKKVEEVHKNSFNNPQKAILNQSQSNQKNVSKNPTSTILCQKKDKNKCSNAYRHLLLSTLKREKNNSNDSDSGDSIKQEMRYFKPIRSVPKTVPKLLTDGVSVVVPLIKVPAKHNTIIGPPLIKKPNNSVNMTVIPHKNSAFVSLTTPRVPLRVTHKEIAFTPPEPKYVVNERHKIVKQYYNKKTTPNDTSTATISSPPYSPVLGFEKPNNVNIVSSIVKSLSDNLNGGNSKCVKKSINNNNTVNLKIINDSKGKLSQVKISGDQERRDLDFARKLHEELNNPRRSTRTQKKVLNATKSSLRKRQVTLDEMISPKKFKI